MTFAKGKTGNPHGRPRNSPERQKFLQGLERLTPHALKHLEYLLTAPASDQNVTTKDRNFAVDKLMQYVLPKPIDDGLDDKLRKQQSTLDRIAMRLEGKGKPPPEDDDDDEDD